MEWVVFGSACRAGARSGISVTSGGEEVHALDAPHSLASVFTQLAGGAVMAVGTWTLAEKSDYISLLSSSTYSATAYILVVAGVVVMVTGILGCCATFKERRNLLRVVSFAFGGWGGRFSLFSLEQCSEGEETPWSCSSLTLFVLEQMPLRFPAPNGTAAFVTGGGAYCQSLSFHPPKECIYQYVLQEYKA